MKRSDALPSASRNLQLEVGVTEFSWIPAYTPGLEIDTQQGPASCPCRSTWNRPYISGLSVRPAPEPTRLGQCFRNDEVVARALAFNPQPRLGGPSSGFRPMGSNSQDLAVLRNRNAVARAKSPRVGITQTSKRTVARRMLNCEVRFGAAPADLGYRQVFAPKPPDRGGRPWYGPMTTAPGEKW